MEPAGCDLTSSIATANFKVLPLQKNKRAYVSYRTITHLND